MSEPSPQYQRSGGAAFTASVERDKAHRQRARSLKPLWHLWPFITRYPVWLTLFLIFLALSAMTTLVIPGIIKLIFDCGFGDPNNLPGFCELANVSGTSNLTPYFRIALIFTLVFSFVGPMRSYFITTLGQRVIADIRNAVYSHLLTLSPAYFDRIRKGEVLSRLTTDTTLIETVITGSISFGIRAVVTAVGAVIVMFFLSWKMGLMVMAIGPCIVLPVIILGRQVRSLSRKGQDSLASASARAGETLDAIQTVQAFTRETYERESFTRVVNQTFDFNKYRIRIQTVMSTIIFIVAMSGIVLVLWYGAYAVQQGEMSGGDIGAFSVCAMLAVSNASFLTDTWTNLLRAAGASERLVEILRAESEITSIANPKSLDVTQGEITFDTVSFHYPSRPEQPVLKSLSFTITPGETVALVGPSGAGKSTVYQLLLRFHDPATGHIRIDGTGIEDMEPEDLRGQFAVVEQNTPLFSGSALDNIRYGRIDASKADVIAAAKAAYAHDFISALPDGYDTDLGERATSLSGGQRQRIVIARAILRNAPILLLDEATSALDSESEQAVQKAFEDMSRSRTTLVIAHRLATVLKADRIIVMDEGQIVDQGTHEDLMKRDGLYARLAALQFDQNLAR